MTISLSGTNAQVLNAVRANSGLDYQNRIPVATDANIHKVVTEITRYTPMWNMFIETLINTIGLREFRNSQFDNRLAPLKRGSLLFGGMIEDDAVNLIKAEHYDPENTNVFAQKKADIVPQFYKTSRRDVYELTINEDLLREAMLSDGALAPFVANLMRVPEQSAEWDEYLIMKDILRQAYEDGMANIQVADVLTAQSQETAGKALTQKLKAWYEKAKFYRNDLNVLGVDSTSRSMVLVTTPEIQASLQVNVLANAFHMTEAQFLADKVVMVDEFPVAGVQAMLLDEDFYRVYDELHKTTSIYNPKGLCMNYFLHVWQVIAYSKAVNAICFSTAETNIGVATAKTVSSVELTASEENIYEGASIQLTPEVTYSDSSTDARAYIIITADSATAPDENATSTNVVLPDSGTYVDENNVLHVAPGMKYDSLSLTAISTVNPAKNYTLTLEKVSE